MDTSTTLLLLALFFTPALTYSQTVHHVVADPEPDTLRCQNEQAARHVDGDVVAVEYIGQWRSDEGRPVSQNAGPNGAGCATERVIRFSKDGDLQWELRAGDVFDAADRVVDVAAMPDGRTVISIATGISSAEQVTSILMISRRGTVEWTYATEVAPRFHEAMIHRSDGRIYLSFQFTDYAYAERGLRVPGGKMWSVGKNQLRSLIVALNEHGSFLWEVPGQTLISTSGGELTTLQTQRRRGDRVKTRYQLRRLSVDGKQLSSAWTPWHRSEHLASAIRHGDAVWITTHVETLDPTGKRVRERTGRLRVYTFDGDQVHTRSLSDSAKLAANDGTCAVQIVSPVECRRGVDAGMCVSSAFDVLVLRNWRDSGRWSRVNLGTASFDIAHFEAASTSDGLFVSARSYDRTRVHAAAPGVSLLYTADGMPSARTAPPRFVWYPLPPRPTPKPRRAL